MPIRVYAVVLAVASAVLACQKSSEQPFSPSMTTGSLPSVAPQSAKAGIEQHTVVLFDACDPETFNAVLGQGTCTRSGGIRFDKFLEQLGRHQTVGSWHFAPHHVTMRVGQTLVASNRGGEAHTFTEVEEFGGGIVDQLNQLAGLTTVAPECDALAPADFLAPGASSSDEEDEAGVEKYQCCIHPWMKAEVRIKEK